VCSAILLQKMSSSGKQKIFPLIIQKHRQNILHQTKVKSEQESRQKPEKMSFCLHESSCKGHTYSKIAISCSLGAFFNPATMFCKRLTLCVAEATGVMTASFSRRYLLPVSGVEGANNLFC